MFCKLADSVIWIALIHNFPTFFKILFRIFLHCKIVANIYYNFLKKFYKVSKIFQNYDYFYHPKFSLLSLLLFLKHYFINITLLYFTRK